METHRHDKAAIKAFLEALAELKKICNEFGVRGNPYFKVKWETADANLSKAFAEAREALFLGKCETRPIVPSCTETSKILYTVGGHETSFVKKKYRDAQRDKPRKDLTMLSYILSAGIDASLTKKLKELAQDGRYEYAMASASDRLAIVRTNHTFPPLCVHWNKDLGNAVISMAPIAKDTLICLYLGELKILPLGEV